MGGQNTKLDVPMGHFSQEEGIRLKKIFNGISNTSSGSSWTEKGVLYSSYVSFQTHCEKYLDDWLARRLADKLSMKAPKGSKVPEGTLILPFGNFISFLSSGLKGPHEEKIHLIWNLATGTNNEEQSEQAKSIEAEEILLYTQSILESYLKCTEKSPSVLSWAHCAKVNSDAVSDFAHHILTDLFHPTSNPKDVLAAEEPNRKNKRSFTIDQVIAGFSKSPIFFKLQDSVLSHCFEFEKSTYFVKDLIPHCLHASPVLNPEHFTLLDLTTVMYLNSQLPTECKKEWRFLFSTPKHGESFSKLLGSIQDKGKTLIIVKESSSGRVFGGYASHSWHVGPKFIGDDNSFLFHLSPKLVSYPSTGYNSNFQYLNIQQKTMPNGLGMGGKLEYFGLWIDSEFGKGKCTPSCTTYSCPQLSAKEEFSIDHLEVWGVGPEPTKDENERAEVSILDKDPEAKAMLELMNRHQASDGYREEPGCT